MIGKYLIQEGEIYEVVSEPLQENLQEQGEDLRYFVYVKNFPEGRLSDFALTEYSDVGSFVYDTLKEAELQLKCWEQGA